MKKHNCYDCVYRGTVPGSVHSSCSKLGTDGVEQILISIGVKIGKGVLTDRENNKVLELDLHGMEKGWADWPVNFDPTWVKQCNWYESNSKETEETGSTNPQEPQTPQS